MGIPPAEPGPTNAERLHRDLRETPHRYAAFGPGHERLQLLGGPSYLELIRSEL